MKHILILSSLLLSFNVLADVAGCAGYYAAKLEDIFSGAAPHFAQQEVLEFGSEMKDEYFQVLVDDLKDTFKVVVRTHTDEELPLVETPLHPMVSFYYTENLKGSYQYPADIPGEEAGAVYLTFLFVR